MSRVIFVGLHNKPHMRPLDSSTKTGKLISRIVELLDNKQVVRTNLYDVDYLPLPDEGHELAKEWSDRISTYPSDTIVLLGQHVHNHFHEGRCDGKVLKVAHPASKRSRQEMDEYVLKTAELINNSK